MPYPDFFAPQKGPISAAKLNKLVGAVRDLQLGLMNPEENPLGPSMGRPLGKIINCKSTGADAGSFSWDEWEFRDTIFQVKPGGIQGRINGLDGWTYPTQFPLKEFNGETLGTVPVDSLVWVEGMAAAAVPSGAPSGLSYYFMAPQRAQTDFTNGSPCTVTMGAGGGTGGTGSWTGTRYQGYGQVTPGTSPAANSVICRFNFVPNFFAAPSSVIFSLGGFLISSPTIYNPLVFVDPSTITAGGFDLCSGPTPLTPGIGYMWCFQILGN